MNYITSFICCLILGQNIYIAHFLLHIPCRHDHHLCGICGICVQGNDVSEDYCETAGYSEGIFNDDIPNCTFVDKCKENPCQNFKRCTSYMAQYFCDCEDNFTGMNCSLPIYKKNIISIAYKDAPHVVVFYDYIADAVSYKYILILLGNQRKEYKLVLSVKGSPGIVFDKNGFEVSNPYARCVTQKLMSQQMCAMLPESTDYFYVVTALSAPVYKASKAAHYDIDFVYKHNTTLKDIILGYKTRFSIELFSDDGKNISVFRRTFGRLVVYKPTAYCTPEITINGCDSGSSSLVKYRQVFARKTPLSFKCVLVQNSGCSVTNVEYLWQIWKLEDNHDDLRTKPMTTLEHSDSLLIKSFSLTAGSYKVKVFLTANFNRTIQDIGTVQNAEYCYFSIKKEALRAVIKGGSQRKQNAKHDLVLDASLSFDPNEPQNRQSHLLFSWSCDGKESFCRPYVTKSRQYVIKSPFVTGMVYNFTLTVAAAFSEPSYANQTIMMTSSVSTDIIIVCFRNCGGPDFRTNPSQPVYLQVSLFQGYDLLSNSIINWSYSTNSKNGTFNSTSNTLIIPAGFLVEREKYKITAVRSNPPDGDASIQLAAGRKPDGGNCTIQPGFGIYGKTMFKIVCSKFTPDLRIHSSVLTYEFYNVPRGGRKGISLLLDSNTDGTVHTKLSEEVIVVRISDIDGLSTERQLNVVLFKSSLTSAEEYAVIQDILDLIDHGNMITAVKNIAHAANLFNDPAHKTVLANVLFPLLKQGNFKTMETLKLYLPALQKVVSSFTTKDLRLDLRMAYSVASSLLQVSNVYFSHNLRTTHIYRRVRPMRRSQIKELTRQDCADISYSCSLIIKNVMNRRLSKRDTSQKSIEVEIGKIAFEIKNIIEKFMTASSLYLLPQEDEISVKMEDTFIWVKVYSTNQIYEINTIPSYNSSAVKISDNLLQELKNYNQPLVMQLMVLDENPFWWDSNEADIKTSVVFLRFFTRDKLKNLSHQLNRLNSPIDVYFSLEHISKQQITGHITKRYDDTRDIDLQVMVYRLEPPAAGGDGKIFIQFLNLSDHDELQIVIQQAMRPDYQHLLEHGCNITARMPTYEFNFRSADEDNFDYIGIIPGSNMLPGTAINFTFEIHVVQCHHRRTTEWTTEGCMVDDISNTGRIHCVCSHLSFFGVGISTPSNKLDPFYYASFTVPIEDNPIIILLVITFLIIYALLHVFAVFKEISDSKQPNVRVLDDNFPGEEYPYIICVYTGARYGAGTTSKVAIKLYGTDSVSRTHVLNDSSNDVLQAFSDDCFLLYEQEHLGDIMYVHVWHNNSGSRPNWYCMKIIVHDLTDYNKYVFLIEKWLSLKDRNRIEVIEYPLAPEENTKCRLFQENLITCFSESYQWVTIFSRHRYHSTLTRSERLAIVMFVIMGTCLFTILFYRFYTADGADYLMPSVIPKDITVTFYSAVITVLGAFIVQFCFRKSKIILKKKIRNVKVDEDTESVHSENLNKTLEGHKSFSLKFLKKKWWFRVKEHCANIIDKLTLTGVPIPITAENYLELSSAQKHWAVAGWILCEFFIWVSAVMVTLIALRLGPDITGAYIGMLILCFVLIVFIMVTTRAVLYSALLAFVLQKKISFKAIDCDIMKGRKLELEGNIDYLSDLIALRSRPEYFPPTHHSLQKIFDRHSSRHVKCKFVEFIFVLLFAALTFLFLNDLWPSGNFYMENHMAQIFTNVKNNIDSVTLNDANNLTSYNKYLAHTFLSALFKLRWYNGKSLGSHGEIMDYTNELISIPRIRQIRMKRKLCSIYDIYSNTSKICYPSNLVAEEMGSFGVGWIEYNKPVYSKTTPWIYTKVDAPGLVVHSYSGKLYHGNGYIAYLGQTLEKATSVIASLVYSGWLNRRTEFIEIKTTIYNINTNMMSILLILTENVPPLGFKSRVKVVSFEYSVLISYINYIYFGCLGIFLIKTLMTICQQGSDYMKTWWDLTDPVFTVLGIITLAVYIFNSWKLSAYIEGIGRGGKDKYYTTGLLTNLHYRLSMQWIVLLNVVFCVVCILRSLRLGRRLLNFYYTLKLAQNSLAWVLILLFTLLYTQMSCVWYVLKSHPKQRSLFLIGSRSSHQIVIDNDEHINKHIVFILYTYFSVVSMYMYCAIIGHSYGVAKYYNLQKYYTNFSHILTNIRQTYENMKTQCVKRSQKI